jgi:hypothetical protein
LATPEKYAMNTLRKESRINYYRHKTAEE